MIYRNRYQQFCDVVNEVQGVLQLENFNFDFVVRAKKLLICIYGSSTKEAFPRGAQQGDWEKGGFL